MLLVDAVSLPHLAKAVDEERERLDAVSEKYGDDWPPDFDGNDIWLYKSLAKYISAAQAGEQTKLDVGTGKHRWFLIMILPNYAKAHARALTADEWGALERVYAQMPYLSTPFPEYPR